MAKWTYHDADTGLNNRYPFHLDLEGISPYNAVKMGEWIKESDSQGEFFFERTAGTPGSTKPYETLRIYFTNENTKLIVKLRFQ